MFLIYHDGKKYYLFVSVVHPGQFAAPLHSSENHTQARAPPPLLRSLEVELLLRLVEMQKPLSGQAWWSPSAASLARCHSKTSKGMEITTPNQMGLGCESIQVRKRKACTAVERLVLGETFPAWHL